MIAAWRAMRDELTMLRHDPGALLILVVAVLVYGVVYPLPYSAEVVRDVPVVVVDQDRSASSRQLARMLDAHGAVRVVAIADTVGDAEASIARAEARGALVIPQGFADHLRRGEPAEVVAVADATYFLLYKAALTGMAETAGTFSAGVEVRRLEARGAAHRVASTRRAPLRVDLRPLFNPTDSYLAYVVPAILLVILHQTLLIGLGLVQGTRRERARQAGGRTRRMAPLEALATLAGRSIVYLALYAAHAAIYFRVLLPHLGLVPRADASTLAWFLLPFLLATIWLGMTVGAIFRTRESAMATVFVVSSLVVFSIGFAWPRESMAWWVAPVTRWLPADSGVLGILRLSQMGASRAEVWSQWSWLWQLALVYAGLAWLAHCLVPNPVVDGRPPASPMVATDPPIDTA